MKVYMLAASAVLALSLLSGCGSNEEKVTPSVSPSPIVSVSPNPTPSDAAEATTKSDHYALVGITDVEEFESFYATLQTKVIEDARSSVADYVNYPFSYYQVGVKNTVADSEEFVADYDKIMTQKVKDAIVNQKIGSSFVNQGGVRIGEGEVWINASSDNSHGYTITSINN
jgi:hypothetical protein